MIFCFGRWTIGTTWSETQVQKHWLRQRGYPLRPNSVCFPSGIRGWNSTVAACSGSGRGWRKNKVRCRRCSCSTTRRNDFQCRIPDSCNSSIRNLSAWRRLEGGRLVLPAFPFASAGSPPCKEYSLPGSHCDKTLQGNVLFPTDHLKTNKNWAEELFRIKLSDD